jgi:hypothetical protein
MSWSGRFDEPIMAGKRELVTLRDAGKFIARLPETEAQAQGPGHETMRRRSVTGDALRIEAPSDVSIGRVDGQQPNRNERVSSLGSSSSSATSGDCRSPMLPAESKRSTSAKPARSRRK